MKDEIQAFIKASGEDLKASVKESVQQLRLQYDSQILFNAISDYMNDPSIGRRAWIICVNALCQINEVEANKRFVEALQNDDADKRFRIVKLLSGYGTEHIVPTLMKMLKDDPEPGVRFMVAIALGDIGDERALPALQWSVEHDTGFNHEDVPISAVAKEAIEKLKSGSE